MKILISLILLLTLTACSTWPYNKQVSQENCRQVGCETGGLVFYPHEHPCDRPPPGQHYRLDSLQLRC